MLFRFTLLQIRENVAYYNNRSTMYQFSEAEQISNALIQHPIYYSIDQEQKTDMK